jgi:hypothetical protein
MEINQKLSRLGNQMEPRFGFNAKECKQTPTSSEK